MWQQTGDHSIHREVIPFWIIALVGLVLSTTAVGIAGEYTDRTIYIVAVNFAAYGTVWVAKYVILDRVMWRATHRHVESIEIG